MIRKWINWLFGQAQAAWPFLPFPGYVSCLHPVIPLTEEVHNAATATRTNPGHLDKLDGRSFLMSSVLVMGPKTRFCGKIMSFSLRAQENCNVDVFPSERASVSAARPRYFQGRWLILRRLQTEAVRTFFAASLPSRRKCSIRPVMYAACRYRMRKPEGQSEDSGHSFNKKRHGT